MSDRLIPKFCAETDHRYEPGAYGCCKRCGGETPQRLRKSTKVKAAIARAETAQ